MNFYFIDLDGTIEDSRLDMSNCVNMIRKKMNLSENNVDEIQKHVTKGMDELYRKCFHDVLSVCDTDSQEYKDLFNQIKTDYEDCYLRHVCVHTKCYAGIPQALQTLSRHGKVIVVTNKPEKISRALLKALNLDGFICDVMGGDSCAECKPSPLPLKIAAHRHGFIVGQHGAFMIGDSMGDVQVAQAFGAKSVWCSWGYLDQLKGLSADVVCDHPDQLAVLIK